MDIYEAADQWKDFEITDVAPVQVTAYEDPDNKGTFYVTFYSSTEAYKVPQTATAFAVVNKATGKIELISVGRIVAADVPVLIKSTQGKVVLKLATGKAHITYQAGINHKQFEQSPVFYISKRKRECIYIVGVIGHPRINQPLCRFPLM